MCWYKSLINKYYSGISNVFVLHGNIGDYVNPGVRLVDYLINMLSEFNMDVIATYNLSNEVTLKTKCEAESIPIDWKDMMQDLMLNKTKSAYIIEYPQFLLPDNLINSDDVSKKRLIDMHKVINSSSFTQSNNILIFIAETKSDINPMFISANSRATIIDIPYPCYEERYEYILFLDQTSKCRIKYDILFDQFAKLTAGLSKVDIEDIYLMAEYTKSLNKNLILERKKELISKEFGEIIELFDTEGYSLENFAGQEHIKSYHKEVVIGPILDGETSIVPKGLLYMGPPGTGKTFFAKCIAGEANINFVEFKMSKILDKYVGQAEKNLEKALSCFTALAPVGVFIDEIDQILSRGDNDSNSVSKNIFGMFLSFLSEPLNRGKILWIGATNYPNRLDEALKRAGRFDKKVPFLPPTKEERIDVFKIQLTKSEVNCDILDYNNLASKTEGYTQAEIENIVVKALELIKRRKLYTMTQDILDYAIDCIIPTKNSKIDEMVQIALDECNDKEFLPMEYLNIN